MSIEYTKICALCGVNRIIEAEDICPDCMDDGGEMDTENIIGTQRKELTKLRERVKELEREVETLVLMKIEDSKKFCAPCSPPYTREFIMNGVRELISKGWKGSESKKEIEK